MNLLTDAQLDALRTLDTPTVCNALEVVSPERRGSGYTVKPFFCPRPELGSMVGYARTGTMRSMQPTDATATEATEARLAYYEHIGDGPGPTITVIEDLDAVPGYGAWWGEVNTNIHKGLGSLGVITNGSIRDLDDAAEGFHMLAGMAGPSHAWVRIEDYNLTVTVHGMTVNPGDLIHADQHGAVVIPIDVADKVPQAAADIAKGEQVLISASQQPGFSAAKLRELLGGGAGH
jgi:regulator of RNase E activity RraA